MVVLAAIVLLAVGAVGGAAFASHTKKDPRPTAASASRQARYLLAVEARAKEDRLRALTRVHALERQQLAMRVYEDAFQDLAQAAQQRVDAYTPVVFRLRGITVDDSNVAITEPVRPPRLNGAALQDIVHTQVARDSALDAVASIASKVAPRTVAPLITRLTNAVSAAESNFVRLARHADAYPAAHYRAVVLAWVKKSNGVTTALSAFEDATIGGGTSR